MIDANRPLRHNTHFKSYYETFSRDLKSKFTHSPIAVYYDQLMIVMSSTNFMPRRIIDICFYLLYLNIIILYYNNILIIYIIYYFTYYYIILWSCFFMKRYLFVTSKNWRTMVIINFVIVWLHASLGVQRVGTRRVRLADAWICRWHESTLWNRTAIRLASKFAASQRGVNRRTTSKRLTKVSSLNNFTRHTSYKSDLFLWRIMTTDNFFNDFPFQVTDQTRRLESSKL